ncbi:hypothetical protein BJY52DRAFT_1274505 [Lactarius psammicola]|nr:hypothetical protein BJY52DRAFT_1274505 [Lactarius psammicola]
MASPSTPTVEAGPRASVYHPKFSLDDINVTSSTTDESPETDSFIYNPSFASSEISIDSYKTERTINSRKSRYNALPRRKYADVGRSGLPRGLVSLDLDVPKTELRDELFSSPLRTLPVRDIHIKANLVQESRPSTRLDSDSFPSLSLPPLPPPPETAEGEDEDTTSDDNETDLHAPSTPIGQSTPPRVFTSPSCHASYISLGSAAGSALVLEVSSLQPASATLCATCLQPLRGETVYAIGAIHHFGCFKCIDCGVVVASKYFTIESSEGHRPLCEADHIRRLGGLCEKCGLAVRGSYVTAFEKQWHPEHFTCTICSIVLAPTDSHFEHERQLYCRQHYLTSFAMKCTGCSSNILEDYVQTADDSCWHLVCYMIWKFWNVKTASTLAGESSVAMGQSQGKEKRDIPEQQSERKLHHIWTVLNTYEKENAACISDVLREVTNSRYVPAIRMLEKLLLSVEALFAATDDLEYKFALLTASGTGIPYVKVARMLCHGIFEVFTFVAKHQRAHSMEQRAAVILELLKTVAGIARYFNSLIRVALRGALKLQHEHCIPGALPSFLDKLHALTNVDSPGHSPAAAVSATGSVTNVAPTNSEAVNPATSSVSYGYRSLTPENAGISPLTKAQKKYKPPSDLCIGCKLTIVGACVRLGTYQRWHLHCLRCQSCNKAATTQTAFHTQVDTSNILYEPMSIKNVPLLGPVPSVVYCTDHAWPTSLGGFLPVSRLEQYAYLLTVSLRRLYARLKDPAPSSSDFRYCVSANPRNADGRKMERVVVRK